MPCDSYKNRPFGDGMAHMMKAYVPAKRLFLQEPQGVTSHLFTDITHKRPLYSWFHNQARKGLVSISYGGVLTSTLLHVTVQVLHSLLNILMEIPNTILKRLLYVYLKKLCEFSGCGSFHEARSFRKNNERENMKDVRELRN
jgi:hypothetical protein